MYKASACSADTVDKAIAWWTNSKYSHCELVVDDTRVAVYKDGIVSWQYDGVNDDEFDVIPLTVAVTEEQYSNFWEYVNTEIIGKKYDWLGIGTSQVLKIGVQDNSKWTCSEATAKMLQVLGDKRFWKIHPGDMSPGDISEILTGSR
jgi:hypothetical protein